MIYNLLKCLRPLKGHEGQLNNHYDLLYMFDINFCHNMHDSEDTAH